jgi:hypothetical protein
MVVGGGGIELMSVVVFSFQIPAPATFFRSCYFILFSCIFRLAVPYSMACNGMVALGV